MYRQLSSLKDFLKYPEKFGKDDIIKEISSKFEKKTLFKQQKAERRLRKARWTETKNTK